MTAEEGGGWLGGLRRHGRRITWRVFAITRCQERHGTLVGRAARLMNTLMELGRGGEHQCEKKCADKSAHHHRAQRDQVAVAKTQLHYAGTLIPLGEHRKRDLFSKESGSS